MTDMKQALISTTEPVESGYRVAQVVNDGDTFPVADTMFWTPCADDIVSDLFWYDPVTQAIFPIPVPESAAQPATTGAQVL